jgi:hypothetical protein
MRAKRKDRGAGQTDFFYLLAALLFLLLLVPLVQDFTSLDPDIVRGFFFSVLMIVGARSLKGGGRYFSVGMILAIIGIACNIVAAGQDSIAFQGASILSIFAFLLVSISYTMKQVAFGTEINANRLVGAVCVYLLLGVIWALAYAFIDLAAPSSFAGIERDAQGGWGAGWFYYSFVTLTTLGYGDILPLSGTARSLAYLEAIVGQFYIAVLVAGLVSAYISDKQNS